MSVLGAIETDTSGYPGGPANGLLDSGQGISAAFGDSRNLSIADQGSLSSTSQSQPASFRSNWQAQLASLDSSFAPDPESTLDPDCIATASNIGAQVTGIGGSATAAPVSAQSFSTSKAASLLGKFAASQLQPQKNQNGSSATLSGQTVTSARSAGSRSAIEDASDRALARSASSVSVFDKTQSTDEPQQRSSGTARHHTSNDAVTPQSPDPSVASLQLALLSPIAAPNAQSNNIPADADRSTSAESMRSGWSLAETASVSVTDGETRQQAATPPPLPTTLPLGSQAGSPSQSLADSPTASQVVSNSIPTAAVNLPSLSSSMQPQSGEQARSSLQTQHETSDADIATETLAAWPRAEDRSAPSAGPDQYASSSPSFATGEPGHAQLGRGETAPSNPAAAQSPDSSASVSSSSSPLSSNQSTQLGTPATAANTALAIAIKSQTQGVASASASAPRLLNHPETSASTPSRQQPSSIDEPSRSQLSPQPTAVRPPLQPEQSSPIATSPLPPTLLASQDRSATPFGSPALNQAADEASLPVPSIHSTASQAAAEIHLSQPSAPRGARKDEAGSLPQLDIHTLHAPDLLIVQDASHLARAESAVQTAFPAAGSNVGSPTQSSQGTIFAALDSAAPSGAAQWTHAGPLRAEAGYQDPALGWVGVRAESAHGQVHATVLPGSSDAEQVLGGQMAGLHAYLSGAHTSVQSVTLAAPENREAAFSDASNHDSGQSMNQNSGQNPNQNSPIPQPFTPLPDHGDTAVPASSGALVSPANSVQLVAPAEGSGAHISVMA